MLELLKILVEHVLKALAPDRVASVKKEKRLTELGTDIFLVYSALNAVIVHGRQIVAELEGGIPWMRRKVAEGEPERVYFQRVLVRISQQLRNVEKLTTAVARLQDQLLLLDSDAALNLEPILAGKLNVLRALHDAVRSGAVVSIDEAKLREMLSSGQSRDPDEVERLRYSHYYDGAIFSELLVYHIPDVQNLRANKVDLVESYLASGVANARLTELENHARALRGAIEKYFSLQDILLAVGDGRAGDDSSSDR